MSPDASKYISPMLAAALHYAAQGMPVFPCVENSKEPACPNGFKDATTDPARIRELWCDRSYNVATSPAHTDCLVVDLDVKKANGVENWAKLCVEHEWNSDTYTIATPSGGEHLWFYLEGSGPTTAGKLGPGIDTRGAGGYVLLPPSIVHGKPYRVVKGRDYADAPSGLVEMLRTSAVAVRAASDVELDTPAAIVRARVAIETELKRHGGEPIEGQGSDDRAYKLAAELRNLGLSADTATDLLHEAWAPHFDIEWLGSKVANASAYAQNEAGVWAVSPAADVFGGTVDRLKLAEAPQRETTDDGKPQHEHRPFRLLKRSDYRNLPPQRWLFDKLLPEVGVVLLVGHSQALKSFVMLDIGAAVASGARAFGSHSPSQTGAVVYVAGEGQYGIKAQRVPAWEKERGVSLDAWPFYLVENMPLAQDAEAIEALADEIGKAIGSDPVRLIVLDTLAHMSGSLKENDSELKLCGIVAVRLSRRFSCCVVIIHHPPKSDDGERANPRGSKANYEIADAVIGAFRQDDTAEILTKLVVDKQKDGEGGYTLWLGAKVIGLGRNAVGQPVSSLVLHVLEQGAAEALKVATDDRLEWATAALTSLAARGDTTVTAGRLARVMRGMKDPTVPQDGMAGAPDQEREIDNLRRALCRGAGDERWRHLARKAGSARTAEWLFSLPQSQGGGP